MATLPVSTLYGQVVDALGRKIAHATVTAKLSAPEVYNGEPVPRRFQTATDRAGQFRLQLWPNDLGSLNSWYAIRIATPDGLTMKVNVFVPSDVSIPLAAVSAPNRGCGTGTAPPTVVDSDSLGWYADVDSDGLYLAIDATGLYAQVETATLTSKPYPVEAVEEIAIGAAMVSGVLAFKLINPVDSIDLGAVFTAGDLRVLLKTASAELESLDLGIALVSGELRTVLKTVSSDVDSMDLGAAFVAGTITEVNRVFVTLPGEEMGLSAAFVSGELA
jgi:hypothetical protein